MISLKESIDRRVLMEKLLLKHNISFSFFDAVNFATDKTGIIDKYDEKKTLRFKGYKLTHPEIGCFASHILLWKLCVELDEPIFILEDNIAFNGKLDKYIAFASKHIDQLGVIKFGSIFTRKYYLVKAIDDQISIIKYKNGACGTSSYIITPRIAQRYIDMSKTFYLPVDDFIDEEFETDTAVYTFFPNLISRSLTSSTIGKRKIKGPNQKMLSRVIIESNRVKKKIEQEKFNIKFKYNLLAKDEFGN